MSAEAGVTNTSIDVVLPVVSEPIATGLKLVSATFPVRYVTSPTLLSTSILSSPELL